MPVWFRHILFFSFLLLFVVTAPLIVLYTAGFRYDFFSGGIVKTGVLHVQSSPKKASIFIDGVNTNKRTPVVIDDIIPGTHSLEIKKDGYNSWTETITIESNETSFTFPTLFLNALARPIDSRNILQGKVNHSDDGFAYLINDGSWLELWYAQNDDTKLLQRIGFHSRATYELSFSEQDSYLLLMEQLDDETHHFVSASTIQAVTPSELSDARFISWDANDDDVVHLSNETSFSFNLRTGEKTPWHQDALAQTVIDGETLMVSRSLQGDVVSFLDDQLIARIVAHIPQGEYEIISTDNQMLLLFDKLSSRLLGVSLVNPEMLLLSEQVVSWDTHESGTLLFTDGFEISTFNPFTQMRDTILRVSVPISDVEWYSDTFLILVNKQEELISVEQGKQHQHTQTTLLTSKVDSFWQSKDGSKMYFFGTVDGSSGIFERRLQEN